MPVNVTVGDRLQLMMLSSIYHSALSGLFGLVNTKASDNIEAEHNDKLELNKYSTQTHQKGTISELHFATTESREREREREWFREAN